MLGRSPEQIIKIPRKLPSLGHVLNEKNPYLILILLPKENAWFGLQIQFY